MARYARKDFGLGKPKKRETANARRVANQAQGKPAKQTKSKLSDAMYTWAKTNMSKLKSPTKAQSKIFEKYKAMKKAGDQPANPKPRTVTPKSSQPTTQPAKKTQPTVTVKTKPQGSGVQGSFRKSNPPSPTVKKSSSGSGRSRVNKEDPRERSVRRNLREAQSARRRRDQKEAFSKPKVPMSPPKNPKEGDTYKKPFGPVMIFKNGKFIRK